MTTLDNLTSSNDSVSLDSADPGEIGLKLFHPLEITDDSSVEIRKQLPFLEHLSEQFEEITGWQVDFAESPTSYRNRHSVDSKSSTVFGDLAIVDMSKDIAVGEWACNRTHCEELTRTLSRIIELVQQDRELIENGTRSLVPTVDLPFNHWALAGSCGFVRGKTASWQIDHNESVRFFVANYTGTTAANAASASLIGQSIFQTSISLNADIDETAAMLAKPEFGPGVVPNEARLKAGTLVEFDPITGHYSLTEFSDADAPMPGSRSLMMVDVASRTAMRLDRNETSGDLFNRQILVLVAEGNVDLSRLNAALAEKELNCEQTAQFIRHYFGNQPCLTLHRI